MAGAALLIVPPAEAVIDGSHESICQTDPNIIMCENFETRPVGIVDQTDPDWSSFDDISEGWSWSPYAESGRMSVITTGCIEGSRCVEGDYLAIQDDGTDPDPRNAGAGFGDTGNFNSTPVEMWYRHYVKYSSNFKHSTVATKSLQVAYPSGAANILNMHEHLFGNRNLTNQAVSGPGNSNNANNLGTGTDITDGAWHCFETHIIAQDAAGSDSIEGWIDGVKTHEYLNQDKFAVGAFGKAFKLSTFWNCGGGATGSDCSPPQNNRPNQQQTFDAFVVSTQRIGCLGAAPVSPPPKLELIKTVVQWAGLAVLLRDAARFVSRLGTRASGALGRAVVAVPLALYWGLLYGVACWQILRERRRVSGLLSNRTGESLTLSLDTRKEGTYDYASVPHQRE